MARGLPLAPDATWREWHEEGARCANVCVALRGPILIGEQITDRPCPHADVFLPVEEGGIERSKAMAFGLGRQIRSHLNAMRGVRN